jgi:TFIIF-interacting CTD phosphatase-like protein
MDVREPFVIGMPDSALGIFHALVPKTLVEEWASATNTAVQKILDSDNMLIRSWAKDWIPTSVEEIYIFITIVISMENHTQSAIKDY